MPEPHHTVFYRPDVLSAASTGEREIIVNAGDFMTPHTHTHTHTHPVSGSDISWAGHVQVCTLLQTYNHASTPPLEFFMGRMPFLPPNQQHQSTEGRIS